MELTQRVERLERQNRRLHRILATMGVLLGLVVFLGQAPRQADESIEARRFAVTDERGEQRLVLEMAGGGPQISLTDSQGRLVMQLYVPKVPDKPAVYLRDPAAGSGVELALTMNGPVLHLNDQTGTRVRLATNELNAPLAAIYDAQQNTLFRVSAE